ncbi:hypothetical protein TrLO_g6315 [Triparma laevis f. longispina]|uniref:WW domain-containing protein n=1 Tax=Triparma laevis f. longispina TaxID=1714387 RepID=A0A9W7FQN0_9STRA|nr:hypothetical protein TrLO_g6315 [Triparma laevis f. longispina]
MIQHMIINNFPAITFPQVICPPNSNWRENVQIAIGAGAAETVTDVMKLHPGNEDVLDRCAMCLSHLCYDPTTAEQIADQGGVDAVLASIDSNKNLPSESIANGLTMIESVMSNPAAAAKVINEELVQRILTILAENNGDPQIALSCLRVLEKVGKTDAGLAMIQRCGGVKNLLDLLSRVADNEMHSNEDAEIVTRATKTLGKMAKDASVIAELKSLEGIDVYLKVLDSFPDNDKIARLGGKFLTRITGDSIEELIEILKQKGVSPALLERTLALLASLAIDSNSSDDIVNKGGVAAILSMLEGNLTGKALEATCRAVARLAHNARNIQGLVDNGAVTQLVAALSSKAATSDSKAQAIEALQKIAAHSQFTNAVVDAKAVPAVLKALQSEPSHTALATACLKFFSTLGDSGYDMENIAKLKGAIAAVVTAMKENTGNPGVQEHGTSVLYKFATSNNAGSNVDTMVKEGAVPVVIQNIEEYPENIDLLKSSMTLLEKTLVTKAGEKAIREGGGVDAVVSAVMYHPDNDDVRQAAMKLVELLSSDELVQQMITGLKKFVNGELDSSEYAKVPVMAMCLGTLAMIPENVKRIMNFGGVPPMIDLLGMVAGMGQCVSQEEILSGLAMSLREIVGSVEAVTDIADPEAILYAATAIISEHPKMFSAVAQALNLILRVVKMCPDLDYAEFAIVEAAVSAIRYGTEVFHVVKPASELMLLMTKILGGEFVAKKNGSRVVVMVLSQNAGDEEMIPVMTNALLVMEIVSASDEGKETLMKQGAVNAIFAVMEKHSNDGDFLTICRRAISNLVNGKDVLQTLLQLSHFTTEHFAAGDPSIEKCVQKLGLMLLCGDFGEIVAQNSGIEYLVNTMANTQHMADGVSKQNLVSACIAAFGRACGNADVSSAIPIVPMIVQALNDNPTIETLKSIVALSKDDAILTELVNQGAVEALLPLIRDGDMDPEMAKWASVALGGLARNSEGGRRIVAGGGLAYLCEYIAEQEDSDVVESINLLKNLANHADISTLLSGGVVDSILDVLYRLQDAEDISGMTATLNLVSKIGATPEGATAIFDKGIPQTAMNVISSSDNYVKDVDCMMAFANMLTTLAIDDNSTEALQTIGASDMLIKAMNANGNNIELVSSCAKALGVLKGAGTDGLNQLLDQVISKVEQLENNDASAIPEFTSALRLCANLMLEEGAMDQTLADKMMGTLNRAINSLRNFDESTEQQEAMQVCLSTLSRLAAIKTILLDANKAVEICQGEFGQSPMVIESACACLGNISYVEGGVNAIASHGLFASVQDAANGKGQAGRIGASGMALGAAKALEVISEQALSQAVKLIGTEGGAAAIASILKAIDDPKALATTLEQVCQQDGGLQALLEALVALGPPDFGGEAKVVDAIIKAMINERDTNGVYVYCNSQDQLAALSAACKINPDSVILMETSAESIDGIKWMANIDGCFEALVAGLASGNLQAAQISASIFSKCIATEDSDVLARLKAAGVAGALLQALKDPKNLADEIFVQNALYSLRTMADNIGVAEMDIGKEGIQIIQDAIHAHSANQYIQDTSNALLQHFVQAFAGGTEALLEDRLRNLINVHANATMWQQVKSDDGSVYFYNSVTGESSWEQAAEHLLLATELDAIMQLVNGLDGKTSDLDISLAASLMGVLGSHKQDAGIMGKILDALNGLVTSDDAAAKLAAASNIGDLLGAMAFHIGDTDMMEKSIDIIDTMAGFEHLRESLNTLEYITTINSAVWTHITVEKLVMKGTRILHQLSFENEIVVGFEMQVDVPNTMKYALQNHMEARSVQLEAFVCLGNLFEGEENDYRKPVCETCCQEMINSFERWLVDEELLEVMLKTVGNISLDDDAIIVMVEKKATAMVVKGMKAHPENEELLRLSIMVISNFGAINDEEQDAYATHFIIEEDGTDAVKDAMEKMCDSEGIVEAAMEALFNLGNDVEAAVDLAEMGVMELTMAAIQKFDYAGDLLSWAIKFLSVFTYAEITLERFATLNGGEILLKVMQSRMDDEQFLQDSSLTLSNALVNEANRDSVQHANGVQVLLQTMDLYNSNPNLVKYVIAALNRLCTKDEVSIEVAKLGMHVFMKGVHANLENTELLSLIFELFGQLAFVKENIKLIVQHGGIKIFLQMMDVFGDQEELMVQTLNTLDNIVSADEEFAAIMIERDGEAKIRSVLAQHPHEPRVEHAGNATLLSMTAMSKVKEQEGSKTSRGALFARLGGGAVSLTGDKNKNVNEVEECPEGDPLEQHRNLLRSGSLLKVYENGNKVTRHVFVSRDWMSIWIKDTASTTKQAKRVYLTKMRAIIKGHGPGHFKNGFSKKQKSSAKEDASWYIDSSAETSKLALECANETDRDQWVAAMSKWLEVSRKWPEKVNNDKV